MKDALITVIEDFLEAIDPNEFKDYMSAGVVTWFLRNNGASETDFEGVEIYHYQMQRFFQKLAIIKEERERIKDKEKANARANKG